MKIFRTVNMRYGICSVYRFFKKDSFFSVFFCLFMAGYIAGTIAMCMGFEPAKAVSSFTGNYVYLRLNSMAFLDIFLSVIKGLIAVVCTVFCLGLFVPGQFVLTLLCVFEGVFAGITVSFLYSEHSYYGILFLIVIILPALLIFLMFQFIMIKRAFNLSFLIFKSVFYGTAQGIYKNYKGLMVYFGIMIAVVMLCGLTVSLGYFLFGRFFV